MENIPTEPRDRPAGETDTEVTPEMVEAGARVICQYWEEILDGSVKTIAAEIYVAMRALDKT